MADELLNWKMFNTTFAKKLPAGLTADAWKILNQILKGVIDPAKVNGSVVEAFKADKKASAGKVYEVKLGAKYYKAVRKKITGTPDDNTNFVRNPPTWAGAAGKFPKTGKMVVHEHTLMKTFEIHWLPVKETTPKGILKLTNGKSTIRLSLTGAVWKPPPSAGSRTSITTEEQEAVSLMIIREVLNHKTPRWKSFKQMYNDKKLRNSEGVLVGKALRKIHKNLPGTDDWWYHFETQYQQIHGLAEFPDAKYNTFTHTKDFMVFISKLVTTGTAPGEGGAFKDFAKFSEKDSWNPADVWLIRKNVSGKRFNNSSKKNPGLRQRLLQALSIQEINKIMKYAYEERIIVGISLKKNVGYTKTQGTPQPGALKFEKVNLEKIEKGEKQALPSLKWIGIKFDPSFDEKKNAFISKTSYLKFEYGGRTFFLDFKSNQGNKQVDITYEFNEEGSKAQLGKIPKDRFTKGMKFRIQRDYPHVGDYDSFEKGSFITKFEVIRKSGILNIQTSPGWIEKHGNWWNMGKANLSNHWSRRVQDPNLFPDRKTAIPIFVVNMKKAWKITSGTGRHYKTEYNFKSYKNIIMYQMFDFLYCVALLHLKSPASMKRYLSDLFYFAQKKGQKWDFGPFGKLY